MPRKLRSLATFVFVGAFVFALAFTMVAESAYAGPCCVIYQNEEVYLKGVRELVPPYCECAPLSNPEQCPLLCPDPS